MFVKKVFQLVKPFLANLHSTSSQKILIDVLNDSYVLNDPKFFAISFLSYECQKSTEFTPILNLWKLIQLSVHRKSYLQKTFGGY
jgi:hypothetical protein